MIILMGRTLQFPATGRSLQQYVLVSEGTEASQRVDHDVHVEPQISAGACVLCEDIKTPRI